MFTIHKFPLQLVSAQIVEIPSTAKILRIAYQGDNPWLWALLNPEEKPVERIIRVIGTGHEISPLLHSKLVHITTLDAFPYVWHFFEETT